MHNFSCFDNNSDVTANASIATKTGRKAGYDAAEQLFEERNCVCHKYRLLRKDAQNKLHPKVMTNIFGEIEGLGPFPWVFDLPK